MELLALAGILSTIAAVASCVAAVIAVGASRAAHEAAAALRKQDLDLKAAITEIDVLDMRLRKLTGQFHGSKGGRPRTVDVEPETEDDEDPEFVELLRFQSAAPAPPK